MMLLFSYRLSVKRSNGVMPICAVQVFWFFAGKEQSKLEYICNSSSLLCSIPSTTQARNQPTPSVYSTPLVTAKG